MRDLAHPDAVRPALVGRTRPGAAVLRTLLDRVRSPSPTRTWSGGSCRSPGRRTSRPMTGCVVNGFRSTSIWPDLGLVVETDGLRYHRTPAQQARDRVRDQAHTAAGLTTLRFTHAQVVFDACHVEQTLAAVARRLLGSR